MVTSEQEKQKIIQSLFYPLLFLVFIWMVKIFEIFSGIDLTFLGIYPLKWKGLLGIATSPLIHSDLSHLIANSTSISILMIFLFYFYKDLAFRSFFLIYFLCGLWLWFAGRESYHIGASGIIYGLASFLFVSGIIRKNPHLMALTLVVTFLYGSMIWGIFPDFFPKRNISWEGHLMGLLAGLVIAIYYRKEGPQAPIYWDDEDEEDEEGFDENRKG